MDRSGPGGTESETLQGWIIKFGKHSKKLRISVEYFVDWMENYSPPWAAYRDFMSGLPIALDELPVVRPVGIGETWRRLFDKCMLKVMGPDATHACNDDQLCVGLKSLIDGELYGVR